jgi:hypothetical protein
MEGVWGSKEQKMMDSRSFAEKVVVAVVVVADSTSSNDDQLLVLPSLD